MRGFLFPRLPTIAGYCVRVRVKLGSSGIRISYLDITEWLTAPACPLAGILRAASPDGRLWVQLIRDPATLVTLPHPPRLRLHVRRLNKYGQNQTPVRLICSIHSLTDRGLR